MLNVVLPILLAATLAFLLTLAPKLRGFSRRDNHHTRDWQAKLEGLAEALDLGAQNALETLPLFIGAVICAHLGNPGSGLAAGLAYGYVGLRGLYSFFYITDRGNQRSLAWMASMLVILALYVLALV